MKALGRDLQAGLTVALVAIPQCMAFAVIAGLPPMNGIYAAVVMGVVGSLVSASPKLSLGPTVTTSTIIYAVLATAAPGERESWAGLAGVLAVLAGALTLVLAALGVGKLVRFVSRTVLIGLVVGTAILILGAQLAPSLGVASSGRSTLIGILLDTLAHVPDVHWPALAMSGGVLLLVLLGARYAPSWPVPFFVLVGSVLIEWGLDRAGWPLDLRAVGEITRSLQAGLPQLPLPPYNTDLLVGAAALSIVGIIQTLTLARAYADRDGERISVNRELSALGAANLASGLLHGFAGAASFARTALNDLAGARTRAAGAFAALGIGVVVFAAAPLVSHITQAATAGLLIATASTTVNWREFWQVLRHDRHDRAVLVVTLAGVFVLPIHWATLIGLVVSVALFVQRAGELRLVEMRAGGQDKFHERPIDEQTGQNRITMLQVEGPLFFAHADELSDTLRMVLGRKPLATIIRMRRTHQIDYSVIRALTRVAREYAAQNGRLILCGLRPELRALLRRSELGRVVPHDCMLEITGQVFGSAHQAIALAEGAIKGSHDSRPTFRGL